MGEALPRATRDAPASAISAPHSQAATAATKVERNDLHATLGAIQVGDRGQALYGNDFIASKIESTGP